VRQHYKFVCVATCSYLLQFIVLRYVYINNYIILRYRMEHGGAL